MNIKIKENLKSTTFWIAVAAFILLMLHTFGVNVIDAKFNQVFNAVLGLLTMLGILNAPQVPQINNIEVKAVENSNNVTNTTKTK